MSGSSHPGVTILRDRRTGSWVARWREPGTRRTVQRSLRKLGLRNAKERRAWAERLSATLRSRKAAVEAGGPFRPTFLRDELDAYISAKGALRAGTLRAYACSCRRFVQWCAEHGVVSTHEITDPVLYRWRCHVEARFSGHSLKSEIARVRAWLGHLRRLRLLLVDRDGIHDAFRNVRLERPEPVYMRPPHIRALLKRSLVSCDYLRGVSDAVKAAAGREAWDWAVVLLLSGMRTGEALTLRWDQVDLAERTIKIDTTSKTRRARTIHLEASPLLADVLAARRLRAESTRVMSPWTSNRVLTLRRHLVAAGVENFEWRHLRATCETYLANSPGIGWSPYRVARQLGHSVRVSERHYVGLVRHVPADATTLEAALGLEDLMRAQVATRIPVLGLSDLPGRLVIG